MSIFLLLWNRNIIVLGSVTIFDTNEINTKHDKGLKLAKTVVKVFFKILLDPSPFVGPLIPLFQISGDVSSEFQSQSGQPYSHFGRGVFDISSLRFTYGVTPLPMYMATIVASCLPNMHIAAEVGCWDFNCRPPAWQSDLLTILPQQPAKTVPKVADIGTLVICGPLQASRYYQTICIWSRGFHTLMWWVICKNQLRIHFRNVKHKHFMIMVILQTWPGHSKSLILHL